MRYRLQFASLLSILPAWHKVHKAGTVGGFRERRRSPSGIQLRGRSPRAVGGVGRVGGILERWVGALWPTRELVGTLTMLPCPRLEPGAELSERPVRWQWPPTPQRFSSQRRPQPWRQHPQRRGGPRLSADAWCSRGRSPSSRRPARWAPRAGHCVLRACWAPRCRQGTTS